MSMLFKNKEPNILDKKCTFISIIWTERYNALGECSVKYTINPAFLEEDVIDVGDILEYSNSKLPMVITGKETIYNDGLFVVTVKGKTLDAIFDGIPLRKVYYASDRLSQFEDEDQWHLGSSDPRIVDKKATDNPYDMIVSLLSQLSSGMLFSGSLGNDSVGRYMFEARKVGRSDSISGNGTYRYDINSASRIREPLNNLSLVGNLGYRVCDYGKEGETTVVKTEFYPIGRRTLTYKVLSDKPYTIRKELTSANFRIFIGKSGVYSRDFRQDRGIGSDAPGYPFLLNILETTEDTDEYNKDYNNLRIYTSLLYTDETERLNESTIEFGEITFERLLVDHEDLRLGDVVTLQHSSPEVTKKQWQLSEVIRYEDSYNYREVVSLSGYAPYNPDDSRTAVVYRET